VLFILTDIRNLNLVTGIDELLGSQESLPLGEAHEGIREAGMVDHGQGGFQIDARLFAVEVRTVKGIGMDLS
jgi:hypothetical protein